MAIKDKRDIPPVRFWWLVMRVLFSRRLSALARTVITAWHHRQGHLIGVVHAAAAHLRPIGAEDIN